MMAAFLAASAAALWTPAPSASIAQSKAAEGADAAPAEQPLSGTRTAECELTVSFTPGSTVAGWTKGNDPLYYCIAEAIQQRFGLRATDERVNWTGYIGYQNRMAEWAAGSGYIRMVVAIEIKDKTMEAKGEQALVAREILEDAVARLKLRAAQLWEAESRLQDRKLRALDEARAQLAAHLDMLERQQANLRADAGGGPLDEATLNGMLRDIETLRRQLAMDTVGKRARVEAIREQIAEVAKKAEAGIKDDAVVAQLEEIVKKRTQQLKLANLRLQQVNKAGAPREDGFTVEQEFLKAEIALLEAQAKLAERRELVSQAAGGDVLARLNAELSTLNVDLAELDARTAACTEQRTRLADLLQRAGQYARMVDEAESLRKSVSEIGDKLIAQRIEQAHVQPPSVEIIGGVKAQ